MQSSARMDWDKLLCPKRFTGTDGELGDIEQKPYRSPFERDVDRIVFSHAFRRLQNKTQVHSLAENDHVRNRMSHSIEAASIARSMGFAIGKWLITGNTHEADKAWREDAERAWCENKDDKAGHIAQIVKAAALAHDIGNPPFGHGGESFIQCWFRKEQQIHGDRLKLSCAQKQDFLRLRETLRDFGFLQRPKSTTEKED